RHHVRFFPTDQAHSDNSGNCLPGLVVDKEIVHSTYMDFYLQSHAGLLGTSRPSHYVVLKNEPQWSADQIQELSYALCHVYSAATRAVSIPAPVYCTSARACARAEFHFRPDLEFADEHSSSSSTTFNLEPWKEGFGQSKLRCAMYFV
ncbi:Piwi-domain-containing protein, partial [Trametopsis cervina]